MTIFPNENPADSFAPRTKLLDLHVLWGGNSSAGIPVGHVFTGLVRLGLSPTFCPAYIYILYQFV